MKTDETQNSKSNSGWKRKVGGVTILDLIRTAWYQHKRHEDQQNRTEGAQTTPSTFNCLISKDGTKNTRGMIGYLINGINNLKNKIK